MRSGPDSPHHVDDPDSAANSLLLPQISRITDRASFARLGTSAIRARSGPLGFRYLVESELESLRVGYAIGRPVGTAVARNRIRRRLRAILHQASLPNQGDNARVAETSRLEPGVLLINVRPQACALTFAELEHATHLGLHRILALAIDGSTA